MSFILTATIHLKIKFLCGFVFNTLNLRSILYYISLMMHGRNNISQNHSHKHNNVLYKEKKKITIIDTLKQKIKKSEIKIINHNFEQSRMKQNVPFDLSKSYFFLPINLFQNDFFSRFSSSDDSKESS